MCLLVTKVMLKSIQSAKCPLNGNYTVNKRFHKHGTFDIMYQ